MDNYLELNAQLNLFGPNGEIQTGKDKEAARQYFLQHVNPNTVFFHDLEEKIGYLTENGYWDPEVFKKYKTHHVKELFKHAYSFKYRFDSFVGAYKFYTSYALKTYDGQRYLERFEDRVTMVALALADGELDTAYLFVDVMMKGQYQPATPTFLNAGRADAGEMVSCFLLRIEDNMESIGRAINSSLQLSKRGGGVALLLSNLREEGAPIKKVENQSSGVIPVMKLLEDSFSYANQLGARQGAGAVYLNAHHPDILRFLDTKRENADEKVRIKTLSLGVVIPDVTFELARKGEDMHLFSPYDVERVYGKPFSDISITEEYDNLVANNEIRKTTISARGLFQTLAEIQFESGYPYIMFEDTVNAANPIEGRVNMSNLCVTGDTEILTDTGYRKVIDLYNTQEDFNVIVDERARTMNLAAKGTKSVASTRMFKTAEAADVYRVTTLEGHEIKATEWHKFYVDRDGELVKIPLAELEIGDKLLAQGVKSHYDPRRDRATVASIEFYGVEDVYDVTVDDGNSVIFNGIATGQCSEILQVNTPSVYHPDLGYQEVGQDISCNLGSLNIDKVMESPWGIGSVVTTAVDALTAVSRSTVIDSVPSIVEGNEKMRSIGLGQMNLHGFLAQAGIEYGSEEAIDFVHAYFSTVRYYALWESVALAKKHSPFEGFARSAYADGTALAKYQEESFEPKTEKVLDLFKGFPVPDVQDWAALDEMIRNHGLYHSYLLAVPPTGNISYVNGATASIHPVTSPVEIRKEGKMGRVYYPAPGLSKETLPLYKDAYETGHEKIIDTYAAATEHTDQGLSLTLFFKDTATTRDINRAQIYAWRKGIKTIYYIRLRQDALAGTEVEGCLSCTL